MSSKLFFNRFVEKLVEKAARCYGKVNNWKSFLLFAPTCSISAKPRPITPNSFLLTCCVGGIIPRFVPADLGKVLARKELLCEGISGAV
jgi:hypothetical protein